MNKRLTATGVAAVIALLIGFGAGYFMPHGAAAQSRGSFGAGGGQFTRGEAGGPAGMRGAARGGFATGEIISKDTSSITLKMSNGNTEIVLVGTSTPVTKIAAGSVGDLTVGTDVVATGSANSDGSLSASSIQIRPAGAMGGMPPAGQQAQ